MRNKKISADISIEAKEMLDAACVKHDRSKGFLLEKMIRRFCGEVEQPKTELAVVKNPVKKAARFTPPTVEEVFDYCNERCNNVDAQNFVDHYTGNGWVRGKTKIKDWEACVRTWEKNSKQDGGSKQYSDNTAQNIKNLEGGW